MARLISYDLEYYTHRLLGLHRAKAPELELDEEFDNVCLKVFGLTSDEVAGDLTDEDIELINTMYFDDLQEWTEEQGFNIAHRDSDDGFIPDLEAFCYMIRMRELDMFPSSDEEWAVIRMKREAEKFARKRTAGAGHKPVDELTKVFGPTARHLSRDVVNRKTKRPVTVTVRKRRMIGR